MRKFILGASAALAAAAGHAAAQGLPTQAPAPIVPAQAAAPAPAPAVFPAGPVGGGAPVVPIGDPGPAAGVDFGAGPANGGARFYTEGSYLLMFLDSGSIPIPLLTGGPSQGIVGRPGTTLVAGNQSVDYSATSGFRVGVGGWLGDDMRIGLEANGLYLGPQSANATYGGGSGVVLARPFFDPTTRRENSVLIASPGAFAGGMTVANSAQAWGYEVGPFWRAIQGDRVAVDLITGFRQFQWQESLNIFSSSQLLAGGTSAFNGFGLGPGAGIVVNDRFGTTSTFYGGNVGARMSFGRGGLFADLTGKVAIGGVSQIVNVDGTTSVVRGGPFVSTATAPGGFLASGNYLGRRTDSRFAVLPEGDLKVGYQFTSWLNLFVGYQVLYLSSVARPGDQLTRNIALTQLETSPTFSNRGTRPAAITDVQDHGLWLHGFSFGVTLMY